MGFEYRINIIKFFVGVHAFFDNSIPVVLVKNLGNSATVVFFGIVIQGHHLKTFLVEKGNVLIPVHRCAGDGQAVQDSL